MKNIIRTSEAILIILTIFFIQSCKKEEVPIITTAEITAITTNSATCGGTITSEGTSTVTSRGVCCSTGISPTITDNKTSNGAGAGTFTSSLSNLSGGTTYYIRAYATNSAGTGYGMAMSFTTLPIDIDGNIYSTITIGTQLWYSENLKTTKLNDGTLIPLVTDNTAWAALTTQSYCWYNNDIANKVTYGALYNWYAVNTGKLCPTGWHVPTDAEWTTLITFHGGTAIAGSKMREVGTTHWVSPNTGATNETGFTALPGGYRSNAGVFENIYHHAYWWSSTEASTSNAYRQTIANFLNSIDKLSDSKKDGFSVRCIKD